MMKTTAKIDESGSRNNNYNCSNTDRYTVLYYKRKNKVHKSKGVSKLDGILMIVGVGVSYSVTLTSDDTDEVVYRGGFRGGTDREKEGKIPNIFDVDEIITVGGYEVEILSCDDNNNTNSNVNNNNNNNGSSSSNSSSRSSIKTNNKLKTTNSLLLSSNRTTKNRNLLGGGSNSTKRNQHRVGGIISRSSKTITGSTSSCTSSGVKRSLLGKPLLGDRKPPAQPKKASMSTKDDGSKDEDDDEEDNDNNNKCTYSASSMAKENNIGGSTFGGTTSKSLLLNRRKTTGLLAFKKPMRFKSTSTTIGSTNNAATTTTNTNNKPKNKMDQEVVCFFPGAIGNPIVPYSIRKVLRPHQIEGVVFLWNCLTGHGNVSKFSPHVSYTAETTDEDTSSKGCILCDEMGLGKTCMTIATISALHRQKRDSRFVVVCPSSLVKNWAQEFDKWLGNVGLPKRVVVKKGGEEGLRQIKSFNTIKPNKTSEVLIISYDLFRMNAIVLEKVKNMALLVIDEGHRLKNTKGSLTMTALKSLPCEARLIITATPVQNNLGDMYTLVNFVCPGVLGNLTTFRREYERPITAVSNDRNCNADKKRRGKESSRILDGILKSLMLRRLQKDVLNKVLPPRHTFLLFCQPTLSQRELYKTIATNQSSKSSGGQSPDALKSLIGLRKICTHPNLLKQTDVVSGDKKTCVEQKNDSESSGKLMVLNALIQEIRKEEPTDKIVIVSNFTSTLAVIEDTILKPNKLNFLRLDGSISSADRQPLVNTFNRTNAYMNFALTLSSKAGGVGLNIIGANRLVMVDPDWNPAIDIQAMARIYRPGQKKSCFIYRCFTSGTIEEVILQRQIQKGTLANMTVDSAQKIGQRMNAEELKECFTLKETCICDTRNKVGKKWPDYNGEESLLSQGCSDQALLAVAAKNDSENPSLAFVHIIEENGDEKECHGDKGEVGNSDEDDDNDNDDEEFEMEDDDGDDDDDGIDNHKANSVGEKASSDEEFEFE